MAMSDEEILDWATPKIDPAFFEAAFKRSMEMGGDYSKSFAEFRDQQAKRFADVAKKDATVHAGLRAGAPLEDIITALHHENEAIRARLMLLEAIAPRVTILQGGRIFIYRCPDEVVVRCSPLIDGRNGPAPENKPEPSPPPPPKKRDA